MSETCMFMRRRKIAARAGVGRGVGDAGGEGIKEFKDFLNSLIINR